jgi:hypothetical protein
MGNGQPECPAFIHSAKTEAIREGVACERQLNDLRRRPHTPNSTLVTSRASKPSGEHRAAEQEWEQRQSCRTVQGEHTGQVSVDVMSS